MLHALQQQKLYGFFTSMHKAVRVKQLLQQAKDILQKDKPNADALMIMTVGKLSCRSKNAQLYVVRLYMLLLLHAQLWPGNVRHIYRTASCVCFWASTCFCLGSAGKHAAQPGESSCISDSSCRVLYVESKYCAGHNAGGDAVMINVVQGLATPMTLMRNHLYK